MRERQRKKKPKLGFIGRSSEMLRERERRKRDEKKRKERKLEGLFL